MGKVVGIDLGTTNSVVAVMEGGKPVVIANAEGMRTTPSVVAFSKEGEKLIGQMARRQSVLNPQNTFYAVKRFVGRKYDELSPDSKRVPYTVRRGETGNVKIKCPRLAKEFAPEEISAMILRKLAEEASQYLGQPVTGAVITVPAYFNDSQRQATRDAGRVAGLEVKRIINEPTAASLAYGLDQQYNQTILVFDLGGGTFDVSVLDVGDGVFEVRSTSGDTQLGGLNFDKKIVDWLAEDFLAKEGVDLRRDRQSLQRLSEAAEKAKIELSGVPVTEINLPFITATADGPKHIETKLERSHFEALCGDLLSRIRGPLQQALADANVTPAQVDEVVLVGGSSRMPMVQDLVRGVMNREPNRNVNPDEVVAVGAAIQAGILTQEIKDILLLDVSPLSLGVETIGGVMKKLIPRNTTIPVRRSDTFSTSENNQTVVEVHIMQGERAMVQDNKSLGRFKLMGIPPAPRGIPQVQVSFDIDANGILQVSALDKTTGRQQSITVQEASNLSEADIQDMIRNAEENAATDRLVRERIDKKERADALTFKAERVLREVAIDFGMQFARDRRRRIEGLVQELRVALEQADERGIDIAQSDLQNEVYELNREAYLYDIDEDGDGILGQIGGTLKRAFAGEDDDYYRTGDYGYGSGSGYDNGYNTGNDWSRQAQWDSPSWNRSTPAQSSSWDDWGDDDWDKPAPSPARSGYGSDPYGRDQGYRDQGYEAPVNPARKAGRESGYGQTPAYDGNQSNYADRNYAGPDSSYGQNSYGQSGYGQSGYGGTPDYDQQTQRSGYDVARGGQGGRDRTAPTSRFGGGTPTYRDDRRDDGYAASPPVRDGYSQDGYPQDNYGQGNTAQNSYPQASSGRDRYPQDGYPQDSYPQDSYPQDGYAQDGYPQDGYGRNNAGSQQEGSPQAYPPDGPRDPYVQRPPQANGDYSQASPASGYPQDAYAASETTRQDRYNPDPSGPAPRNGDGYAQEGSRRDDYSRGYSQESRQETYNQGGGYVPNGRANGSSSAQGNGYAEGDYPEGSTQASPTRQERVKPQKESWGNDDEWF